MHAVNMAFPCLVPSSRMKNVCQKGAECARETGGIYMNSISFGSIAAHCLSALSVPYLTECWVSSKLADRSYTECLLVGRLPKFMQNICWTWVTECVISKWNIHCDLIAQPQVFMFVFTAGEPCVGKLVTTNRCEGNLVFISICFSYSLLISTAVNTVTRF